MKESLSAKIFSIHNDYGWCYAGHIISKSPHSPLLTSRYKCREWRWGQKVTGVATDFRQVKEDALNFKGVLR